MDLLLLSIWFAIYIGLRIFMAKSKFFKSQWKSTKEHPAVFFNFDMIHHYDLGYLISLFATAMGPEYWPYGMYLFFIGEFVMFDDLIGHLRASSGKAEEFILEPMIRPLIQWFWMFLAERRDK